MGRPFCKVDVFKVGGGEKYVMQHPKNLGVAFLSYLMKRLHSIYKHQKFLHNLFPSSENTIFFL